MMKLFQNIFGRKSIIQQTVPFLSENLKQPIRINRASLSQVKNWIDSEAFKKSWFQYGVPDFIRPFINLEINDTPTYSDFIVLIGQQFFKNLDYLEIGVSVGKNFYQILNAFSAASLTGFDIEEINPILEQKLAFQEKTEWETPESSIKKNHSSLRNYSYNTNQVKYLCADVWDENSWAKLKGNKYNIVFSDALHSSKAILFEFEMLVKYELLNEKFVIVWDDLVGTMKTAFLKIIKKYHAQYDIHDVYLLSVNGWMGQHEGAHSVGIISNFSLK